MSISPFKLYLIFLKIGFLLVGGAYGGVALYDRVLREEHGLISRESFEETLSVASSIPGPITVNMAVMVGYRLNGYLGALLSLLGLLTPSVALSLALTTILYPFRDNIWFKLVVRGIMLAVIGLLVLTTYELLLKHTAGARNVGVATLSVVLIAASIISMKVLKLPLLVTMGLTVAVSILAYRTLGI